MTLLVGVLCKDGAVIAADRQISHGAMGATTVGQAGTKVRVLNATSLFASSGPVGLGQQISGLIEASVGRHESKPYIEGLAFVQAEIRKILVPAFEMAKVAAGVLGPQAAVGEVLCGSLLALKFGDGLKVVEFSPQGGFEHLSEAVPFVCIDSGKQNADPFLRFIWSIFWPQQLPPMRDAILAAYWTIAVVSDLRAPGVGMGCDVFVLEGKPNAKGATKYTPRQIPPEELAEHEDFIKAAEDALRSVKDSLAGGAQAKPASEPPKLEIATAGAQPEATPTAGA